ncbi:MAG: sensor histidine kinase [Chloroflexota bacterium]|nr:MAG: sensor histidine kinase [Chloroflexota bacterium]
MAGLRMSRWLSFAGQFRLAVLTILVVGMLIIGSWVGQEIEASVVRHTAAVTALYVDSIVTPQLQSLLRQPLLVQSDSAALDRLLVRTSLGQRIVAFKVWVPEGTVLYSPDRALIGRSFDIGDRLTRALNGEVVAGFSDLRAPENEYERERWSRLLEVYVPIRDEGGGRVFAVAEFYQLPDALDREVAAARLRSWVVVVAATGIMYALLSGLVGSANGTIAGQQAALRQQVVELSQLLEQNQHLHERVRRAGESTTTLNERALLRISADLHDGPAQDLALALLRLDQLEERCATGDLVGDDFAAVREAMYEALAEIRAISTGLRLPELTRVSLAEVVERAVRDHERRGNPPIEVEVAGLPAQAPVPVKIAVFRTLQEALANASRHGGGLDVRARIWAEAEGLCLQVSDRGPGFVPEGISTAEHLGLAGMRERAELLGGSFQVESAPGQGTTVRAAWPLTRSRAA